LYTEYSNAFRQSSIEPSQAVRDSPLRVSPKKSLGGSHSRSFERNRSPAPMREIIIPQEHTIKPEYYHHEIPDKNHPATFPFIQNQDEDSTKNNRNRFKKKLVNRSKSAETPMPFDDLQAFNNRFAETEKYFHNDIPSIIVTNETPRSNRPFLQRQNALNSNKYITKSLGDNLNRAHERTVNNNLTQTSKDSKHRHRHHHHHNHHRNSSRKNHRRSKYASSSLTSSEVSSETEYSHSLTNTSRSSSSDFSPRQSTLNLHRMIKSKHQVGYDEYGYKPYNINRTRNCK